MKTRAAVRLSAFGSSLFSRPEAKGVTERLTEFKHPVLDFSGVEVVGQGFCDGVLMLCFHYSLDKEDFDHSQ